MLSMARTAMTLAAMPSYRSKMMVDHAVVTSVTAARATLSSTMDAPAA